jgi:hypothetical protein
VNGFGALFKLETFKTYEILFKCQKVIEVKNTLTTSDSAPLSSMNEEISLKSDSL